jgi:hypothetical protein
MIRFAKAVAAFVGMFVLYGLRAWIVLAAAFFGVAILRAVPGAVRDREWVEAFLLAGLSTLLLVVSFRWFSQRWSGESSQSPKRTP